MEGQGLGTFRPDHRSRCSWQRTGAVCQQPSQKLGRSALWTGTVWKETEVKGQVKEKWGKLTDDDLAAINGRRDQLEGKIQERYGLAKDQAKKEIDD
jgi:uncharacterized protein YjbJ (UPF0337 family)